MQNLIHFITYNSKQRVFKKNLWNYCSCIDLLFLILFFELLQHWKTFFHLCQKRCVGGLLSAVLNGLLWLGVLHSQFFIASATSHKSETYLFSYVEESNAGHNIYFFLVHSLSCGTANHYVKSRNGVNCQMMKVLMQMQIQVTLQTYATITTVHFFSEKKIH